MRPLGGADDTLVIDASGATLAETKADLRANGRPAPARGTRPRQRRGHARTYLAWWVDEELAQRVADGVNTETTRRQYADRVRFQINPLLGTVRLRDLSAMQIRQWQATLGQLGRRRRCAAAPWRSSRRRWSARCATS